eukprot:scaffold34936_cov176-Amphora_coffeaeformis.AAC.3
MSGSFGGTFRGHALPELRKGKSRAFGGGSTVVPSLDGPTHLPKGLAPVSGLPSRSSVGHGQTGKFTRRCGLSGP